MIADLKDVLFAYSLWGCCQLLAYFFRVWNRTFPRGPDAYTFINKHDVDSTTETMEIEGRSYSEVLKSKKDETDQMENDTPKDKQLVLDTSKVPKAELHNGEC